MTLKPTYEELVKRVKDLEQELKSLGERVQHPGKSELFLETLIRESPHAIWILDEKGTLMEINPACCELLSVNREDLLGKYNILEDNILIENGYMALVKSVFEKGDRVRFTIQYETSRLETVRLDKIDPLELDVTIFPVKDDKGNVTNAVIQHKDITEQKLTEEALSRASLEWKSTVDAINDAIWVLDKDHRILNSNKTAEKLFASTDEDIKGKYCWEVVHGTDEPVYECPVDVAKRTGQRNSMEMLINGLWYEFIIDPIFDENNEYAGAVHIVSDITRRKLDQDALRESQRKLVTLMSNLPGMAYRCKNDKDWTMEFISDGCLPLTGYRAEELVDSSRVTYAEIINPEDRQPVWGIVQKSLEAGKPFKLLYRITSAGGEEKWVWERGQGVFDDAGDVIALEGFITDITERKQVEKDLEKLKDQLSQAQKMESVGRLAGGVAHDFNNMLSAIIGNAELSLFEIEPKTPLYNRITQILEAANRSANITRQLLGFARKQTIRPIVMDLNSAVEEMLKMLRRLIGEDIELIWHPGTKLWQVKMDPAQIDQILANLCVNAKDAITSGAGKITIETDNIFLDETFCAMNPGADPGEYVKLFLSDNGTGMDKETIDNIFEPFYTTKEEGKGTGLGLSTVYGIVKQNKGFIDVFSKPGTGTIFKIYLPRYAGKNESASEEIKTEIPRGNGEVILIVEDEFMVLEIARIALDKLGYKVLEADSPSKAMEVVSDYAGKIDLLLTDLVMPEMSGKDLSGELIEIYPEIKTLYMSGYTPDKVLSHGILGKDMHFIQKPFTVESLARRVSSALKKQPVISG